MVSEGRRMLSRAIRVMCLELFTKVYESQKIKDFFFFNRKHSQKHLARGNAMVSEGPAEGLLSK